MDKVQQYIEQFFPPRSAIAEELTRFADENAVPIMEPPGIETLLQLLRIQQPGRILEIGTAIGYSAIRIAEACPDVEIVSIERDAFRAQMAKKFLKQSGFEERVTLLEGDALELAEAVAEFGKFDAVFIDAAKSQNIRFFELYEPYFSEDVCVYTDNVLFKGLVAEQNGTESRNVRQMLRKLDRFNQWIAGHEGYHTVILPVGDGLSISKRKKV
ncbi:SAM-dependent methyltransferase [Jeotgalibacillus malaysiensis]|uniref:tRNA 5-hydroxyuridine methyltransferase n=1 Tax=Jeotgalibacillus malaysiensis TaxID=1508404 RepID=A0A0B5ASQ7_9BACL|nr:O-methyltransferase [Jeotgalibacillus malaysiensis]AJD91603.1 SAM-dependent methyltransferase [Jeotgalibacillus malaysiensis]